MNKIRAFLNHPGVDALPSGLSVVNKHLIP